jgi:hypothetical protein
LPGSVRIVSAATGATLVTLQGWSLHDGYGMSVANVGDVDGDGQEDLILGAPQSYLSLRGYVQVWTQAGQTLAWDIAGGANGDRFGAAVGAAGDLDQNGQADLLIGAPGDDFQANDAGSVRVLSGASGQPFYKLYGSGANAGLGAALAGGFDANGDHVTDFALGAPGDSTAGSNAGFVRVVSSQALAMTSDRFVASISSGDVQQLSIDVAPGYANQSYVVLGSMSGTQPSVVFGGLTLPLVADRYFAYLRGPVIAGPIKNGQGSTNASGHANASFDTKVLPLSPSFVGQTFYHAFVILGAGGQATFASNAVPLTILP